MDGGKQNLHNQIRYHMKNESTLWALLGQSAEPEKYSRGNVPEGEYQVDFTFPDGQVSIAFMPYFIKTEGMKSIDPLLVPDDPDTIYCYGIEILSVYSYDHNGGQTEVPITPEISTALSEWIKERNYLNCDAYDF